MSNRIWITWETQRRSIELSKVFNCKLFLFDIKGRFRYPISIIKTLFVIIKQSPDLIFVQNPSMLLTALVCLYKKIFKKKIIVDRHSTLRWLLNPNVTTLKIWIFRRLHYFTIRTADLTIVTNEYILNMVNNSGGNAVILPDKIPSIPIGNRIKLTGRKNILLIASFGKDEPISEVVKAAGLIQEDINIHISGNYRKIYKEIPSDFPSNVKFTGFIPEEEFFSYIHSVDIIMALTTSDYCMLCGCYEAVSAEKPLITSNKQVLIEYFKNALFVDNTAENIADTINKILANQEQYNLIAKNSKIEILDIWNIAYEKAITCINKVETN